MTTSIMPLTTNTTGNDHGFVFKKRIRRPIANSNNNNNDENNQPPFIKRTGTSAKLNFPAAKRRLVSTATEQRYSVEPLADSETNRQTTSPPPSDVIAEVRVPLKQTVRTPLISRTRNRRIVPPTTPTRSSNKKKMDRRATHMPNGMGGGDRFVDSRSRRKSTMTASKSRRRRSTFSMRGKRASSIGGGFRAIPHASVEASNFYRHISPEMPEPIRLRQLLAWCALRVADDNDSSSSFKSMWPSDLPIVEYKNLTNVYDEALRDIHLAFEKGSFTTSWYQRPIVANEQVEGGAAADKEMELEEHPENRANREAKERLTARIAALKREDEAWVDELKRAGSEHAKALDKLPKAIKDLEKGTSTDDVPAISCTLNGIDWSSNDETVISYISENQSAALEKELKQAETDVSRAVKDIEVQLDGFHLTMHKSNEVHQEAREMCGLVGSELGFGFSQRRARSIATVRPLLSSSSSSSSSSSNQASNTNGNQADATRDLLRTLSSVLGSK